MVDLANLPTSFVNDLRALNVIFGILACVALVVFLARPRWREWNVPTRLGWMALFLLVLAGTYGTYEILYLKSNYRVPMVTLALIWALVASVWPRDRAHFWTRKR